MPFGGAAAGNIKANDVVMAAGNIRYNGLISAPIAYNKTKYEPVHEISNNVVCVTSKGSDQPAHMRSLIRAFASQLNIL